MTTNILALTDALGNLVCFRLMPGHRHDCIEVPPLIDDIAFDGLIADKAFYSNALVAELHQRGTRIVNSSTRPCAKAYVRPSIYTRRHLVENFFCKLKEFKRISMRACKTGKSFEAMIYLAAAVINSQCFPTRPSPQPRCMNEGPVTQSPLESGQSALHRGCVKTR